MKRLAIVWYSRTGGSRQLAEAARDGALEAGDIDVRFLPAAETQADDLLEADGYLFACPENLAAIAGVMKAMFDRTYYDVLGKIEGRPYAALICAGSDGENAQRQRDVAGAAGQDAGSAPYRQQLPGMEIAVSGHVFGGAV